MLGSIIKHWVNKHFTVLFYLTLFLLAAVAFWPMSDDFAQFNAGMQAAVDGNYEKALKHWRPLAEKGYATAQHNVGVLYEGGRGVPADPATAARWYRKAAQEGLALAQVNLGLLYLSGAGVARDPTQAAAWFEKAAKRGNPQGQNNLGNMYLDGLGVEQDFAAAATWYRMAAESGNHRAQYRLAELYRRGEGLRQDPVEAYAWFAMAGAAENAIGMRAGKALENIEQQFTPQQRMAAQARVQTLRRSLPTKTPDTSPWASQP